MKLPAAWQSSSATSQSYTSSLRPGLSAGLCTIYAMLHTCSGEHLMAGACRDRGGIITIAEVNALPSLELNSLTFQQAASAGMTQVNLPLSAGRCTQTWSGSSSIDTLGTQKHSYNNATGTAAWIRVRMGNIIEPESQQLVTDRQLCPC